LPASKGKTSYERVTQTSIALRQAANDTGCLLLVLCQLSRDIEHRTQFVPMPSDLKDSGQLEQDADVITFLVWPHRIESSKDPQDFQVWVAKNRNRPINQTMVECRFEPSRQRIREVSAWDKAAPVHDFGAYNAN
jgi:replicative DNA helicase